MSRLGGPNPCCDKRSRSQPDQCFVHSQPPGLMTSSRPTLARDHLRHRSSSDWRRGRRCCCRTGSPDPRPPPIAEAPDRSPTSVIVTGPLDGIVWIRGSGDGTGSGVAGYRRQREVHGGCLAAACRRCIGTGRFVGIRLATVAIGLDVQTLLVGVPGTDERASPGTSAAADGAKPRAAVANPASAVLFIFISGIRTD